MTNGYDLDKQGDKSIFITLTTNEVANVLGENYKSISKTLDTLATEDKIKVTEKLVNNRPVKAYVLTSEHLQGIKSKYQARKHLQGKSDTTNLQLLANALNTQENVQDKEKDESELTVKFYEVKERNLELTKENEKLRQELQQKVNENVRLDADLTVVRAEVKYIEDKSKTMESAWAEEKQRATNLEKTVQAKNIQLLIVGAILLVVVVVITCYFVFTR